MEEQAAQPGPQPISSASTERLAVALRQVLDKGLPCSEAAAGDLLLNLRSVFARAVIPSDALSRLQALNGLLPRVIVALDDQNYREACQILFAIAPGTRGSSLTSRQRAAAKLQNFNESYFRTAKQADLLQAVAVALHDDLLRYQSRVKRASESLEPTGDTPALGPEHLNAEEELVSRIWQHVYGLRAELIATLRLSSHEDFEAQAEDHRQAAIREHDKLRRLITEYADIYGQQLIRHGEAEYGIEALERLAGWSG